MIRILRGCLWKCNRDLRTMVVVAFMFPIIALGQETFDYKAVEARIKKHIYSSPDSTKMIIDEVLSKKDLHDTIKGMVYNIYGIYYSHMGQLDSSGVQYRRSLAYLKKYPRIRTMPLGNLSINYRNKGQYDESFKCLEEVLEISKNLGLKDKEGVTYSNMSSNYQFMLEYDKAIEYALKGIKVLKEINSPLLASTMQKLANIYLKMENFNFAKDLYEDCLKIFRSQNDMSNYNLTLVNYGEVLIHLGKTKEAKKALNDAIKGLKKLKHPGHVAIAYSKLGRIAKDASNLEEACRNYRSAVNILAGTNSINAVIIAAEYIEVLNKKGDYREALPVIHTIRALEIYKSVNRQDRSRFDIATAETFSKTDNHKEAIAGLERAIKAKDSLARAEKDSYSRELQAKFQTELQNEKSMALKAKNAALQKARESERTVMYIYIAVSLGLILLTLLYLRSYWLKGRLHKERLKYADAEKDMLRMQHKYEQELTQAQKEVISEKQRELASSALKMANYQDKLQEIVERLDTEALVKVADAKKELELLVKQKDYWRQFEARFNNLHPDFSISLAGRYANLTKNDVEFCALLKLNLSNKEIAQMLQISPESAITKKYRIKKKMNITDDPDFEKVIMGI